MKKIWLSILWAVIAILGALSLGTVALKRGEPINAIWLVTAALCIYAIAYRYYSRFIANTVLKLDDKRKTPAEIKSDGKDYVPTNKWVLYGHHFAAIAGAGPLVGPVLAAQMGYLPGLLWIVIGVILAGAVQDFIILFGSMRRMGKSLGEMIKEEINPIAGAFAKLGIFSIMIILIAVLALVVVKALAHSPWGLFTLASTIPIAIFMGLYMRFWRPGRVGEASIIGFILLLIGLWLGKMVAADPVWGPAFTFEGKPIALMIIAYGMIASSIPVWLLLAPRDYLSTFLKIGVIAGLAVGIFIVGPHLQMPAISTFVDGTGPVFSGKLFPFLFITIACGSISGFHALISSGTTPKMIERESHAQWIGYGGMLTESFVAVMALIAACSLTPGVYFAMNSPGAVIGTTVVDAAAKISSWGFMITPDMLTQVATNIGESSILSRTGGAPTLAVGMAYILSDVLGGEAMMAFWYHFAILFEALFILTTVDAGTRVGRFMVQEMLGWINKDWVKTNNLIGNLIGTVVCAGLWGYFLYQGVTDPLGGINTLWPLFGIANQMLAGMALIFATTMLLKMGKAKYSWVTITPMIWLLLSTLTAGWQKLFDPDFKVGFLAQASRFQTALADGKILGPAKTTEEMSKIIFNNQVDAALCGLFMVLVVVVLIASAWQWYQIYIGKAGELKEAPPVYRTE